VSSALFELFADNRDGLSVYNDLDAFSPATNADYKAVAASSRALSTVDYQHCQVEVDSGLLRLAVSATYHIVRSYRHGNLNGVAFDGLYGDRNGQRKLLQLLMGFDINCTQAGIDLATGHLECTPAFREFWQTRQLRITNVQTPNHTAMRWFKKRHELPGAFGDDDAAMETVSLLHHVMTDGRAGPLREQADLRWRFGKKNARLYQSFHAQLSPYFSLETDAKRFNFLTPRHMPDRALIDLAHRYPMRLLPYW
jgi:hypothetical protein